MMDEILTILFIQVDQYLGIRLGVEAVSQLLETISQLDIVEDLSVENNPDTLCFVMHRLLTGLKIDNGKTNMSEANVLVVEKAGIIRTSMNQRSQHGFDSVSGRWALRAKIENPCYPTHDRFTITSIDSRPC